MKKTASIILLAAMVFGLLNFTAAAQDLQYDFNSTALGSLPNGFKTIGVPNQGSVSVEAFPDRQNKSVRLLKTGGGNLWLFKDDFNFAGSVTAQFRIYADVADPDFSANLLGISANDGYSVTPVLEINVNNGYVTASSGGANVNIAPFEQNKWLEIKAEVNLNDMSASVWTGDAKAAVTLKNKASSISQIIFEQRRQRTPVFVDDVSIFGDELRTAASTMEEKELVSVNFTGAAGKSPDGFSLSGVPENGVFSVEAMPTKDDKNNMALKSVGVSGSTLSAVASKSFESSRGLVCIEVDFIPTAGVSKGKCLLNIQGTSAADGKEVNVVSIKLENNRFTYYNSIGAQDMGQTVEKGGTYRVKAVIGTDTGKVDYFVNNVKKASNTVKYPTSGIFKVRLENAGVDEMYFDNLSVRTIIPPIASKVAVIGEAKAGAELSGTYTYEGKSQEGNSEFKWLQLDKASGDYIEIPNATSITYKPTLAQAQAGAVLRFEVTPVDQNGIAGKPVRSKPIGPIDLGGAVLQPLVAENVTISGNAKLSGKLTASYTIKDQRAEGQSKYRWLMSDTVDGEYVPIQGANQMTFLITSEQIGKYLKFEVTPCDKDGIAGESVCSEPTAKIGDIADFEDLGDAPWAQGQIKSLVIRGAINGVDSSHFAPNDPITRAQFIKIIIDAFGLTDEKATSSFSDIIQSDWCYKYAATAQELGILDGIYQGAFSPNKDITRQEMAAIAYRTAKVANITLASSKPVISFDDQDSIAPYATEAVSALSRAGIISGLVGNKFEPQALSTRAQAAKLISDLSYQTMDNMKDVHPRLFITKDDIAVMRRKADTSPQYAKLWEIVKSEADKVGTPPEYRGDKGEQLWLRTVGNSMANLAAAYIMTGDRSYSQKAEQWALKVCSYPKWGDSKGNFRDLPIGHLYVGLALVYDWLYDEISPEAKKTIFDTITARGKYFYNFLVVDAPDTIGASVLQNHMWIEACGLALSAMAVYDGTDEFKNRIDTVVNRYLATKDALMPDGASNEGVGYWQYGVSFMMMFMHNARSLLGINLYNSDWWKNTAYYQIYLSTPEKTWGLNPTSQKDPTTAWTNVDFGDCPRYNWYGPDYIMRGLSREFRNGYAQTFANMLNDKGFANPQSPWLNLIWYDDTVEPRPLDELPTTRYFDDMDIVSMRSDWSGDGSLVSFKCGPAIGHRATDKYYYDTADGLPYIGVANSGHAHPDAGSFNIYAFGDWLIRNGGYNQRRTQFENTLLVDKVGQLGQPFDLTWWDSSRQLKDKLHPRITKAKSTKDIDFVTGDVTDNYPMLKRYVRHLIYIKPDNILIVLDDIQSQEPKNLELLFHTDFDESNVTKGANNSALVKGDHAVMRITPLTSDGIEVKQGNYAIISRDGKSVYNSYTMTLINNTDYWRNATAFTWAKLGSQPKDVKLTKNGNVWTFDYGSGSVSFDWDKGEVK